VEKGEPVGAPVMEEPNRNLRSVSCNLSGVCIRRHSARLAFHRNALQFGLVSIVTKTGDKGETSLMYGRRLSKADPRVDVYGCVDELNAAFGLARALSQDSFVSDQILAAQKDLIVVMGELATAREDVDRYLKDGFRLTTAAMVDRLSAVIVDIEKDKSLYPKEWVIPGKKSALRRSRSRAHDLPPG